MFYNLKGADKYIAYSIITAISIIKYTSLIIVLSGLILPIHFTYLVTIWSNIIFILSYTTEILLFPKAASQSIFQLLSLPYIHLKESFKLPSIQSYNQKNNYILPFEKKWLVVNGGVSKQTSHCWNMLSQRYAYDFLIVDENLKSHTNSSLVLDNYHCYGKNILAPSDGIVVELMANYHDGEMLLFGLRDKRIKDIRGNYIVIKHRHGEYSVLAHLMKNSILVEKGQKVKQGDIIAKCGNSGNSSEPHLHFQVQKGVSFCFSAGVPVKFDNFTSELLPKYENIYKRAVSTDELHKGFLTRGYVVKSTL